MGLRKNFLDYLPCDQIDTSSWVSGQFFTVSFGGAAQSVESAAHGVVLLIDTPDEDVLYQFAEFDVLNQQYGDPSVRLCRDLLDRAIRRINRGNYQSPAPSVVRYSSLLPFRYPSREFALARLFRLHVAFLLPADQKTREEGGTLVLSSTRQINAVLASMQMAFGKSLDSIIQTHVSVGNVTMLEAQNQTIGIVEVSRENAACRIIDASAKIALMRQQQAEPVTILAIAEEAGELATKLAGQLDMLRRSLGVHVQIGSHDQTVSNMQDWIDKRASNG